MIRIIRELRRREVFRTLGLYIGVCWLIIEAASILLPTFGADQWMLRGLVIVAVAGFPVAGVLAWIYDLSVRGIERDADHVDAGVPPAVSRKLDFVVIGVLLVALSFSVYLNLADEPVPIEELEPITVLIADFDNSTGDEVFNGALEQALMIGLEIAPHISLFNRNEAMGLIRALDPDAQGLPAPGARLLAVREGIGMLVTGAIMPAGPGYQIAMSGLEPTSGTIDFALSAEAADRDSVLATIASLSREFRDELGDPTLRNYDPAVGSRTTSDTGYAITSIDAAKAYADGLRLAYEGEHEAAIEHFRSATELEPEWGSAYAAWAISEFYTGRLDQANVLWEQTTSLLDTMSEAGRLQHLGTYFALVTQNYERALENFAELVEKYPASSSGRNNLAVTSFYTLDFERATEEGGYLVELFPGSRLYRSNLALYAMYASEFEMAARQARTVVEDDPGYAPAWLPLAISALDDQDTAGALAHYRDMADAPRGFTAQVGEIGLADTYIYVGDFDQAREILLERIARATEAQRPAAAIDHILLAESYAATGEYAMAVDLVNQALALSDLTSIKVAAALVFLAAGDSASAGTLADELAATLTTHSRAYAMMIEAAVLREAGEYVNAADALRSALDLADLWRIRWELGRTYLGAGYFAEALGEFLRCYGRRGEGAAMFLDDVPTYRYLVELPYWTARAQSELGMRDAAAESFERFLVLRPEGALAEDARQRMP